MQIELAYGKERLTVTLPSKNVVKVFHVRPMEAIEDPAAAIRERLRNPIFSPPLAQIADGKRTACIVVSDRSRPVPNRELLPPILETLENAGIEGANVLILIATGLHEPGGRDDVVEILGEEIADAYNVEWHDAEYPEASVYLGMSPRDVPIRVNRRYIEADVKILTGLIEPHLMAGYSGGRKSICPGIAGRETICAWHAPRFIEHEKARYGILDGNPIHEEALRIARKAGCDFIVNTVIDASRRIGGIFAGDLEGAHHAGIRFARKYVFDTVPTPVDIVVTSAAGYPLDHSWYQAIKGVAAAADIVKPGGTIILAAACEGGLGHPVLGEIVERFPTAEAFMEAIHGDYFRINQWQLEELAMVLRKARVRVVCKGIDAREIGKYYVVPAPTVESAVADELQRLRADATIAVIPEGPYVLAKQG